MVFFLFLFLASGPLAAGQITPEALDDLPKAAIVLLGEVHDNPAQHRNQARAIAAIKPAALVFEMLTDGQAAAAIPAMLADPVKLEAALGWRDSGWPDFAIYYPIFLAAPSALIRGANLPRQDVRRAIGEGAAAVFGKDAARFGLERALSGEEQAAREDNQRAAHCDALPADMLGGMVEAQRLRDAALAAAALAALDDTGGPVVVITGNGHARRDWGVPSLLAIAAPGLDVLSIGQFEDAVPPDAPYDHYLVTEAVLRDDPCAAFRKN